MRHWYLLVLLSFLGVAVFGFSAMDSKHGTGTFCLAEITNPAGCLTEDNTFSLNIFHTSVFKSFSLATVLAGLAFLIFSYLLAIFAVPVLSASNFVFKANREEPKSNYLEQLILWLRLQEKRDPSAAA